jgi:hypothetical protein
MDPIFYPVETLKGFLEEKFSFITLDPDLDSVELPGPVDDAKKEKIQFATEASALYQQLKNIRDPHTALCQRTFAEDIFGRGYNGHTVGVDRIENFILLCRLCDHWELQASKEKLMVALDGVLRKTYDCYQHVMLDAVENKLLNVYVDFLNIMPATYIPVEMIEIIFLTAFEAKEKATKDNKQLGEIIDNIMAKICELTLDYPSDDRSEYVPIYYLVFHFKHYNDRHYQNSTVMHKDKILILIAALHHTLRLLPQTHYAKENSVWNIKSELLIENITDLYVACRDFPQYQATLTTHFPATIKNLQTLQWSSALQKETEDYNQRIEEYFKPSKNRLLAAEERQKAEALAEAEKQRLAELTKQESSSCRIL